jgi:Flp pilus assembly protein TadD
MTRTRSAPTHRQRSDPYTALAVSVALVLAVAALYAQTAHFEFLSLDDSNILLQRQMVRQGLTWAGLGWAFTTVVPDWNPMTWLSHMLAFSLFAADPGPHHLINVALHAANAVLLFLALRALTGALWPSALVAALFAVHPLRAESVAWVVERKDTLSGLFWMLTLLAYARYGRRPSPARYALVVAAFALGIMSKTMLVSLPVVLLLLDLWPLGRWRRSGGADLGRLVAEKLPMVALGAGASVLVVLQMQNAAGLKSTDLVSIAWRAVSVPIAYVTYLAQTVWPAHLAVIYPHPALIAGTQVADFVGWAIGATVLLAAITGACVAAMSTRPYLIVGWLWYLVTLVPVIGIVQVGTQSHADRFTYLPLIGIYLMVAWGLRDLVAQQPRLRAPAVVAAGLVLAALAAASWRQIDTFRNSRRVFEHAIAVTDNNYFAHQVLGMELRASGQLDDARRHLDEAVRIRPAEAYAHEQLGLLFESQGDRDRAAAEYETAVRLSPRSYYARANLGAIRLAQGQVDEAVALLSVAAQDWPNDGQVVTNLGTALLKQERYADATPHLERAARLAPNSAQAHNNLGVALAKQGRYADAATQFERTLALNPNHPSAAQSLQWVRDQMQQQ